MKNTLLLTLLMLFTGALQAQVINIPDAALKAQLLSSSAEIHITADANFNFFPLDANGDGEIQQSEADLVISLVIGNQNILSFEGIQHFNNVDLLVINMFSPVTFDFNSMPNLKRLQIQGDISNITLNGSQSIEELDLNYSTTSTINLQNMPALKKIFFYDGAFTNLTFHGLPSLTSIRVEEQPLTNLTVYNLPLLKHLRVSENQLTTLDLSGVPSITWLDVSFNPLTSVNLQDLPNLSTVGLSYTNVTEADFSNSPNVYNFSANHAPLLQYVNLKNGSSPSETTYLLGGTTSVDYICIDEGDFENVSQSFGIVGSNVEINTYCSFTPGGNYNTITGTFNYSADGNCTENILTGSANVSINNGSETGIAFTNTGSYNFYTQSGAFTLTPQFENNWFTVTPASATVTFADNNNNAQTQNFCVSPNGVHPDVEVVIIPVGAAQPGFDAVYQILYRNKGNQALSGDITFIYDEAVLDYVSAVPAESSSSAGSLVWNYINLLPFESREIFVTLNLNGPMETPALEIGDQLDFGVAITPVSGDETPEDNAFGFKQIITGSFDPNDITCLEGTTAAPDKIGEYLHYNINFENTGNAAATFIVVKDMINEDQFDVNTLQLMYASHDVEVRVQDNKIEFFFDDIQLGPLEKGNLVFKIKTKNTLLVNDDVTQQANIYFDYNWPIETNEATTVFQVLSTGDFAVDSSVKLYPNPAADFINITAESSINSLQLYDVQGRLLQAVSSESNTAKLDISARAEGMYYIKIMTEAGVKVGKIVKK